MQGLICELCGEMQTSWWMADFGKKTCRCNDCEKKGFCAPSDLRGFCDWPPPWFLGVYEQSECQEGQGFCQTVLSFGEILSFAPEPPF